MDRHTGGRRAGAAVLLAASFAWAGIGGAPIARALDAAAARSASAQAAPKVVVIVGPAGDATASYRRLGDEAAAVAAKSTPNVVRVYSPDATWTNVKAALHGASIVVYLGHGNGWPSIYRNALDPLTQDGFGLNPHDGAADAHQYFGEGPIGDEIRLAPHAVVIFSHLCYASGNSEPGLAEGSLAVAQQRVDNYAAGFLRAGAGAVIADSYLAPAYYVGAILAGEGTVESIWTHAPDRHDHFLRFASRRSNGAIAEMDPDSGDSGFHRSIVLRGRQTSAAVVVGAVGGTGTPIRPLEPTLIGLGVTFEAPNLASAPTAGTSTTLRLPMTPESSALLPVPLMVATRWDRLDRPGSAGSGAPAGSGPTPSTAPSTTPTSVDPSLELVLPEVPGEVVAPVPATRLTGGGIAVSVTLPATPGLYRLVATVHVGDGVAYDAASQALIPALVVHVTGPLTAAYAAPSVVSVRTGAAMSIEVTVTNLGRDAWGTPAAIHGFGLGELEPARRASLVGRWVDLGASGPSSGSPDASAGTSVLPAGLASGSRATVALLLTGPASPGEYLVVLDVVDPSVGSLAALGVPPGIIRVTVTG